MALSGCLQSVQLVLKVLEELLDAVVPEHDDVSWSNGLSFLYNDLLDVVEGLLACGCSHGIELSLFEVREEELTRRGGVTVGAREDDLHLQPGQVSERLFAGVVRCVAAGRKEVRVGKSGYLLKQEDRVISPVFVTC